MHKAWVEILKQLSYLTPASHTMGTLLGIISSLDNYTNARPVAYLDDNKVIVNLCEAAPFRVESNITKHDKLFWIKEMRYNIKFMLAHDPLADRFMGGTVYQGFLNSTITVGIVQLMVKLLKHLLKTALTIQCL